MKTTEGAGRVVRSRVETNSTAAAVNGEMKMSGKTEGTSGGAVGWGTSNSTVGERLALALRFVVRVYGLGCVVGDEGGDAIAWHELPPVARSKWEEAARCLDREMRGAPAWGSRAVEAERQAAAAERQALAMERVADALEVLEVEARDNGETLERIADAVETVTAIDLEVMNAHLEGIATALGAVPVEVEVEAPVELPGVEAPAPATRERPRAVRAPRAPRPNLRRLVCLEHLKPEEGRCGGCGAVLCADCGVKVAPEVVLCALCADAQRRTDEAKREAERKAEREAERAARAAEGGDHA